MTKKKPNQKYKIGTVVAIPLPGSKYAFAKVFRNTDLGVYDLVSTKIEALQDIVNREIKFFQPTTDSAIKSGEWLIIGEEPFADEESSWGPPKVTGVFSGMKINPLLLKISFKGQYRRATLKEIEGMEIEAFCQRPEMCVDVIVDRLLRGNNDKYQIKL